MIRIFRTIAIGMGLSAALAGQGYQSSFSEVKYDRARTPATFHGGAEVDLPSGALTYNVPLGPGIGARGARYVPTLSTRWAPQVAPSNFTGANQVHPGGISCVLTPGYFVLSVGPPESGVGSLVDTEYLLPDGSAGSGPSLSGPGPGPTGVNPAAILQDFGLGTSWTTATFQGVGVRGELLLYLYSSSNPERKLYTWEPTLWFPNPPKTSPVALTFPAPGGILVVSPDGATATVFVYVNPQYRIAFGGSTTPTSGFAAESISIGDKDPNDLLAVHYLPSVIRNRFGDEIQFDHFPAGQTAYGLGFKASWLRNGSVRGSVTISQLSLLGGNATLPGINGGGPPQSGARIQVAYSEAKVSNYTVDAYAYFDWSVVSTSSWGSAMSHPWDRFRRNLQPSQVKVEATGETVVFEYADSYVDSTTGLLVPTTLKSLTVPGRKTTFSWGPYTYRRPKGWTFADFNQLPEGYTDIHVASGVVRVDDKDLTTGGQTRTTTYTRVVPKPDAAFPSGPYWTSTTFKVGVNHPDGRGTLTRYAEPLPGYVYTLGSNPTASQVLQVLANLKNLPTEVREYAKGVSWAGDSGVGGPGLAYRVTLFGPPAASGRFAVSGFDNPYWSLKRVGNPSGILDPGGIPYSLRTETWAPEVHRVETRSGWDSTNFGWRTKSVDADCTGSSKSLVSTFSYDSNPANWLIGRVVGETHPDQPEVTRDFSDSDNTLSWVKVGGSAGVTTNFTYQGLPQPDSATLNSPTYDLSGQMGATYTFDTYGFVNSITPKGMPWNYQQSQDSLGRPTDQTNPQGIKTTFTYTNAGRMDRIQPPNGESATGFTYDTDHLGVTITRNQQWSHLRYNGFGELVSETRATPNGPSARTFTYDLAGRKLFEYMWGGMAKTSWVYDTQGRLSTVTDPNGMESLTTYSGPSWSVQVGGPTGPKTTFTKDALGRLVKVVDAQNQTTDYTYDNAGRVLSATQSGTQIRTWSYSANMHWLDYIVQPESGKTSYSRYTVAGNPTVTTYGDQSNGRKTVTATPDGLGRVKSLSSSDGSVVQGFSYVKDKLDYAFDRQVRLNYAYAGLNGRLSSLTTTVWNTGPATATGAGDFASVQGFDYNADGLRKSASVDGRKQDLSYFDELGAPKQVNYTGAGLNATLLGKATATNANGLPTDLTYANSSSSHLDYRADGVGLAGLRHSLPSGVLKNWIYSYETAGRLAGQLTSDGEDTYDYDLLGRLTSATVKVPDSTVAVTQTYEYDAFGNPLASTATNLDLLPAGIQRNFANFRFNAGDFAATNRVPARTSGSGNAGDTGADYDPQGNLIQIFKRVSEPGKSLNLQYDALGRVTLMHDSETGLWEKYCYTPDGLRTRVETYQGTAIENLVLQKVQHRIYNDQRQLVSEYEAVRP